MKSGDSVDPIRVVIADDHALVREGTREFLSKDDRIKVIGEAKNGLEAVSLIEELDPDVALVDIAMPGINGIEVTRRVKASRQDVAILVLTVHDEDPYVVALLEAGAAGYLLKDVQAKDLIEAVHAVYTGESVLHPALIKSVLHYVHKGQHPAGLKVDASPLSQREFDVLRLAAHGISNKQIAHELEVSPRTVQTHLANVFEKLNVASRTEAVVLALRCGWLDIEELG